MKVQAKINDVVYTKESGKAGLWMIILTDKGTFKGTMLTEPKSGDDYEFNGDWKIWNGQKEFKFIGSMPVIPADPYALLCYVCHNAKGVGPKLREEIWYTHGENWQEQFDGKVKPLGQGKMAKGLTSKKTKAIQEAIELAKLNEVQVKVISFLMQHKCSETLAYKAWNEWREKTIPKVEENCFCLTELIHIGFGNIDGKIREAFKMDFADPRRIKAGVLYSYKQCTSSGNTAVKAQDFITECEKNLRVGTERISKILQIMLEANNFKLFTKEGIQYFSSWESYLHELEIWNLIKENSKDEKPKFW